MSRQHVKAEPVSVSPVRAAPKSRVNRPGDRFEVEAERLSQRTSRFSGEAGVETQAADPHVQRAAEGAAAVPALGQSLQLGGGEPLSPAVESEMSGRLGHSFAGVRVHRDGYAGRMSEQLNAKAFAYDQHLFFGDGAYDPYSAGGQRLIAHELVHTLQQRTTPFIQRQDLTEAEEQEMLTQEAQTEVDKRMAVLRGSNLTSEELQKLSRMQAKADALQIQHRAINQSALSEKAKTVYGLLATFIGLVQGHLKVDSLWRRQLVRFSTVETVLDAYAEWMDQLDRWEIASLQGNNRRLGLSVGQFLFEEYYLEAAAAHGIKMTEEEIPEGGGTGVDTEQEGENVDDLIGEEFGGTHTELSDEQQELINQLIDAIAKGDAEDDLESSEEHDQGVKEQILLLLESFPDVERADILRILPDLVGKPADETQKSDILEALEKLIQLSEAERQMLITNKILHPEAQTTTDIPEQVQFALTRDADKKFPDTGEKDENINQMQNQIDIARDTIRNKGTAEEQSFIDKLVGNSGASVFPFFNELLLFEGLLIGASEKNSEIKGIAQEITHDIAQIRTLIQKEIAILAAEMAGTVALSSLASTITAGGSLAALAVRLPLWADKLRKLHNLLEKIEQVYQVIESVQQVVEIVNDNAEKFDQYAGQFDLMYQEWQRLQAIYDSAEAPDDIEEQIEALEETLISKMETQLGDKMGEVLSQFYIPEDASEEELLQILFDIPRGIDAFRDLLSYYFDGRNDTEFRATLLGKAIAAGALLYPVVGYLAYVTQDRLSELISEMDKSMEERMRDFKDSLLSGAPRLKGRKKKSWKKANRDDNQKRISPSKRKEEAENDPKYKKGLKDQLEGGDRDSGEGYMELYLQAHGMKKQKGDVESYWTDSWFKTVARTGVKELNKEKKSVKINGKPLPRFKLKHFKHKPGGPEVTLSLNPTQPVDPANSKWLKSKDLRIFTGENPTTKGILVPTDQTERKKMEKELHDHFNIPDSWDIEQEADYHKTTRSDITDENTNNGYVYIKNGRYYWADLLEKGTQDDPIKIFWHKRPIEYMQQHSKIKLLRRPKPDDQITAADFEDFAIKDFNTIHVPKLDTPEAEELTRLQYELSQKQKKLAELRRGKELLDAEKKAGLFTSENQRIEAELTAAQAELAQAEADLDALRQAQKTTGARDPSHYGKITPATERVAAAKRAVKKLEGQQAQRQEIETADFTAQEADIQRIETRMSEIKLEQERNPQTQPEDIGVDPQYYPVRGKKIQRSPSRKDSEKEKFRKVMKAAGIEHDKNPDKSKAAAYQIEHIIDNAYDGDLPGRGADTRRNLWPITARENPTPWQLVNAKTRQESGQKGVPNYKVGSSGGALRFDGLWFEIADFVPDSVALSDDMVYEKESWFTAASSRR